MTSIPIITIDGPSCSGKGTIALLVAQRLHWHLLDSGALYRVLAYAAFEQQVSLDDPDHLEQLAHTIHLEFVAHELGAPPQVLLNHQNITLPIRSPLCSRGASKLAVYPGVRTALLEKQRSFAKPPGLVADGRDMGTVVFPEAQLKIFLNAAVEERAKRRVNQLKQQGENVTLEQVLAELKERDERDTQRSAAPLKPATDAVIIDTTVLSIEMTLRQILQEAQQRFQLKN